MKFLGLATALMAAVALIAALVTMLRSTKTGTAAERGWWVIVVFVIPIFGPLFYLSRFRRRGGT